MFKNLLMIGILMDIEYSDLHLFPLPVRRLFRTSIYGTTNKWIRDNRNLEVQMVFRVIQIQHLKIHLFCFLNYLTVIPFNH